MSSSYYNILRLHHRNSDFDDILEREKRHRKVNLIEENYRQSSLEKLQEREKEFLEKDLLRDQEIRNNLVKENNSIIEHQHRQTEISHTSNINSFSEILTRTDISKQSQRRREEHREKLKFEAKLRNQTNDWEEVISKQQSERKQFMEYVSQMEDERGKKTPAWEEDIEYDEDEEKFVKVYPSHREHSVINSNPRRERRKKTEEQKEIQKDKDKDLTRETLSTEPLTDTSSLTHEDHLEKISHLESGIKTSVQEEIDVPHRDQYFFTDDQKETIPQEHSPTLSEQTVNSDPNNDKQSSLDFPLEPPPDNEEPEDFINTKNLDVSETPNKDSRENSDSDIELHKDLKDDVIQSNNDTPYS